MLHLSTNILNWLQCELLIPEALLHVFNSHPHIHHLILYLIHNACLLHLSHHSSLKILYLLFDLGQLFLLCLPSIVVQRSLLLILMKLMIATPPYNDACVIHFFESLLNDTNGSIHIHAMKEVL
jgi:hypothetical protein